MGELKFGSAATEFAQVVNHVVKELSTQKKNQIGHIDDGDGNGDEML